jgi:hypothetical protein
MKWVEAASPAAEVAQRSEASMRSLRWIAVVGILSLAACGGEPTAPLAAETEDCSNTRRPCDQVLPEATDRLSTPFLSAPTTVVIGGTVSRR